MGFPVYIKPCVALDSILRPGCIQTHRRAYPCLLIAGIKGVGHHAINGPSCHDDICLFPQRKLRMGFERPEKAGLHELP